MSRNHEYEELVLKQRRVVDGTCPGCHRPVRRNKTFIDRIPYWRKDNEGHVEERRTLLVAAAAAWTPDLRHQGCRD